MMTDISEQKRLEAAMRESLEGYRTIFEHLPVAIFVTDEQGNVNYVNKKWLSLTGGTLEDALRGKWVELIHPEDKEWVVERWYKIVREHGSFLTEFCFQTDHGVR